MSVLAQIDNVVKIWILLALNLQTLLILQFRDRPINYLDII
jgi:hypothetical protein